MTADTEGLSLTVGDVTKDEQRALRRKLSLKGVVFMYVGRLVAAKGILKLLKAWRDFAGGENVSLLLVGDGPLRKKAEKFCQQYGLDKSVRFTGAVDYDNLAPYYAVANCFVIPTLEDNWSLVVPEAMACGLPILCSKYNGCWPELVHDGANGWVFDPRDRIEIVDALLRAARDRRQLAAMGKISKTIVAQHTPQDAAKAVLEACRIACGSANRSVRFN
jgi:glycosyltransferase involved in cell wall biosynthesis